MTNEQAVEKLKILKEDYWDDDGYGHESKLYDDTVVALEMAINALEQEPIIDKIRAEIEKTTSRYTISRERGAMGQVEWSDRLIKESEVLEIINKYKTESEE